VLPKPNRLRNGADFNLVTKTGKRFAGEDLVIYVLPSKSEVSQVGLIVNRFVSGSVTRHLVSRKLRHTLAAQLPKLNQKLMLVVRVLSANSNYTTEVEKLCQEINVEFSKTNKADA
jgi:ribonuclease P protein component